MIEYNGKPLSTLTIGLDKKLKGYFIVTEKALKKVKINKKNVKFDKEQIAGDFLDMAKRYFEDAKYFEKKGDKITAFAALNYAHAFLDAGARIKVFDVKDSKLFMVD